MLSAAARALTTEAPILDPVFLSFFLALWAPISPKNLDKSRKKRYQGSMSRADANGSKKLVILDCLRPRKLSPRLGESTIFGFWPCAEKASFGSCFGPSFWSVCELHAQKTRFQWVSENCFISEWIFEAFWASQNRIKINKNSILGVILGQDGSKEVSS